MEILQQALKLVQELGGDIKLLTAHGFKQFCASNCCHSLVMVNHDMGVVVKNPFIMDTIEVPKHAIPTLEFDLPDPRCSWKPKILIQPLADISNQELAYQELVALGYSESGGFDFASRNVGHYEGKPVLIDW